MNNIEYGVYFTKNLLNVGEQLFEETEEFTDKLIFEKSEVVFIRKPQYKKKMFGLTRAYQNSTVLYDVSDDFFNGNNYEVKYLKEFDHDELTDVDKLYDKKPQRENERDDRPEDVDYRLPRKERIRQGIDPEHGYCIRTSEKIPFDPERPMCYSAWKVWDNFGDYDYPEAYCHKTGNKSNGRTSMAKPIL